MRTNELLNRPPISINLEQATNFIKNKTVLITGAGGSIGSELARQVLLFEPKRLVLFGRDENGLFFLEKELKELGVDKEIVVATGSICDTDRVDTVFDNTKPDIVYHAAANKHVPLSEANVSETIFNNIYGTRVVADMAVKHKCHSFVMVSTDKAVKPTSVMGATKRVAELYVKHLAKSQTTTTFTTVRFGNVLGSAGSVVPIFQSQIDSGGPVKITHLEMTRFFMTIPEASLLIIQASIFSDQGQTFILDMGEPVKIVDLAERMIQLNGLVPWKDIHITVSGIRPGEKIHEELSFNQEDLLKTSHEKVLLIKDNVNTDVLIDKILDLEHFRAAAPPSFLKKKLSDIIPEATLKV